MLNKKIFFFIAVMLSPIVKASAISWAFLHLHTQVQAERNYNRALEASKKDNRPLIAYFGEPHMYYLKPLIELGFNKNDFTVRDAHWVIEKFETEHMEILSLMLKHAKFEDLLTESYYEKGNLLTYCLEQGYTESFSKIIESFPRLMANPAVSLFNNNIGVPYQRAFEISKQDSIPMIAHLMAENSIEDLDRLISFGLTAKKFTNRDLLWVIKESEHEDKAKLAFDLIFTENLTPSQKSFLIGLISTLDFLKENSFLSTAKSWLGGHSHSEVHSLLVYIIEQGYLKSFKQIISILPNLISDPEIISAKRYENAGLSGWSSYSYVEKKYNLSSWLMRGRNGEIGTYLKTSVKPYYLEAGRIILKQFMGEYDPDNHEASIDPQLFGLIQMVSLVDKEIQDKLAKTNIEEEK
jgi:hypothetical protein